MDNANFLTYLRTVDTSIFRPAYRPKLAEKAPKKVPSPVIIRFEDSVARGEKQQARHNLDELWAHTAASHGGAIVRVKAPTCGQFLLDIESISNILHPAERLRPSTVIMLAKAESARSVHELQRHVPGNPLLPVIESALGEMNALDVAAETGAEPEAVSTGARHARLPGFRGTLCIRLAHIAPARTATGLGNPFRRALIGAAS